MWARSACRAMNGDCGMLAILDTSGPFLGLSGSRLPLIIFNDKVLHND